MRINRGMTFIEIILYVAIFSIVLNAILPFAITTLNVQQKTGVQEELSYALAYATEKLNRGLREYTSINSASSNFGVNFASNPAHQLALDGETAGDSVIFNVVGGRLMVKYGAAVAAPITPDLITVTNLTFTNNSSPDNKTKNITYELTLDANFGGSGQAYVGNITTRSSVESRTR